MLKDVMGKELQVGQTVVRPYSWNKSGSCALQIRTIRLIKDNKVFLDGANTAIKYPDTLAIVSPV